MSEKEEHVFSRGMFYNGYILKACMFILLLLSILSVSSLSASDEGVAGLEKTVEIKEQYINLPVKTGATKRLMRMYIDNKLVREFTIEYAETDVQFHVFMDVTMNGYHKRKAKDD